MFPEYIVKSGTKYKLSYTYSTIAGIMGRYVNEDDNRDYAIITVKQAMNMEYVKVEIKPCKVTVMHTAYTYSCHHNTYYTIAELYMKAIINGY